MDFWTYTPLRDAMKQLGVQEDAGSFYRTAFAGAVEMASGEFYGQLEKEAFWEQGRRPYYNVWPSIVPMLTRLNLDIDSAQIQLPLPALCIRLPKQHNPLTFEWQGQPFDIRCMLMGAANEGKTILILIDIGEVVNQVPVYTYQNFLRQEGLTVERSLAGLPKRPSAEVGVQIPDALIADCVRLCCSLCLLENDPSVIEPDVLSKDRDRYESTGDQKYVDKAHRRGKVGWNVGRHIEVAPHYRRPHMALVWTGRGRAVPKIVPRRGTIVHRSKVETVPSGFERV